MGHQSRTRKKRRNPEHPTMFVLDGSIRHYEGGSMLELYSQITQDEWTEIIIGTIQYKIFLDCLKDVACPVLHETWTREDDWFRLMLDVNLGRMKNLDPLQFATIRQDEVRTAFEAKIKKNAAEVADDIKRFRDQHRSWLDSRSDHSSTNVSEL